MICSDAIISLVVFWKMNNSETLTSDFCWIYDAEIILIDQVAFEHLLMARKKKIISAAFLIFIILRINPTTSGLGLFELKRKKLGCAAHIIGPILVDVAFPLALGKMPEICL